MHDVEGCGEVQV